MLSHATKPGNLDAGMTTSTAATAVGGAIVAVGATWVLLIVLARRLPPGTAKDLARFLPDCVVTVRRLRGAPLNAKAKLALAIAAAWLVSPIDLIPEFLPVIGPIDDVVVVALALRYVARQLPRATVLEAWPNPENRHLLVRLLGGA